MAKKLSALIGPRAERKLPDGEQRFIDKHIVKDSKDRIGKDGKQGNDDKLFKASNVKVASRAPHHGFTAGEGEAVYETREEKMARIDELSKKTLGSYVSKASDSLAVSYKKKEDAHSDASKIYQMKHGRHGTDTDKHLDKASDSLNSLARKHGRTVSKRAHGIDKAVKRLTKEEKIEQIQELSKKTLASYAGKAAKKIQSHMRDRADHEKDADASMAARNSSKLTRGQHGALHDVHMQSRKAADKSGHKANKHAHYIGVAAKKLAKEDKIAKIDSILSEGRVDEVSDGLLKRYIKASDKDYSKQKAAGNKAKAKKRDKWAGKAEDKLMDRGVYHKSEETLSTGSIFAEGFDHDKWVKYYNRAVAALNEVQEYLDGLKGFVDKTEDEHTGDYECWHDCYNIKSLASQIESVAEDVGKTLANKKADEKAHAKWKAQNKVGY